jgi:hypothetical protein
VPPVDSRPKDPVKVRVGRLGGLKRWADGANRRQVRLDELTPSQRRLVMALIDAAKAEAKKAAPVTETSGTAEAEVRGGSLTNSAS